MYIISSTYSYKLDEIKAIMCSLCTVWTGSGLDRVFAFGEEQTTITCTIDMRVIIQDVSSVGLQMIGG